MSDLEAVLQVTFKNPELLKLAVTHRSAASEGNPSSNERLEFLGDSIIGMVISEHLYRHFPANNEGHLAKSKAFIVSEGSLAAAALQLGLEEFLVMGPGEVTSGGRKRSSILSDAFEAVIGAVYLDRGITVARNLVKRMLAEAIQRSDEDEHRGDYKSALQERTQALCRHTPAYTVTEETGQEHDKTFSVEVSILGSAIGRGTGKSKKQAEQAAACDALDRLEANPTGLDWLQRARVSGDGVPSESHQDEQIH